MTTKYKLTYNIDIVFCIDRNKSMAKTFDIVKESVPSFWRAYVVGIEKKQKLLEKTLLRVGEHCQSTKEAKKSQAEVCKRP